MRSVDSVNKVGRSGYLQLLFPLDQVHGVTDAERVETDVAEDDSDVSTDQCDREVSWRHSVVLSASCHSLTEYEAISE